MVTEVSNNRLPRIALATNFNSVPDAEFISFKRFQGFGIVKFLAVTPRSSIGSNLPSAFSVQFPDVSAHCWINVRATNHLLAFPFCFAHLAAAAAVAFFFRWAGVNFFADAFPPSLPSFLRYSLAASGISSFAMDQYGSSAAEHMSIKFFLIRGKWGGAGSCWGRVPHGTLDV